MVEGRENGKVWRFVGVEEVGLGIVLWREVRKRERVLWVFIILFFELRDSDRS